MKKILIILVAVFALSSCGSMDRIVWVNPEAEACGVSQPLHNIDWLRQIDEDLAFRTFQTESESYYDIYLTAYKCDTIDDSYIVTFANTYHTYVEVRDCSGEMVMQGVYHQNPYTDFVSEMPADTTGRNVPCVECDEFFANHHLVDKLSHYQFLPELK